jgi:hypothetical protein
MFDSMGLAPNKQEEMEGAGGGCYVPIRMRDITGDWSPAQRAAIDVLWGGAMPKGPEDHCPGNGVRYWDCPAEYFTIGVNMLMADRQEVVHNLCMQLTWWTLESTRLPEPMDYLSGDRYVKVVKALARTLEPIGDVDVDAALHSEMFDSMGWHQTSRRRWRVQVVGAMCPSR